MLGKGIVPAVLGELAAGIVFGKTGLGIIPTADPTLSFLSDVGFAMLMFGVGMNVPLHEPRLRSSLGRGTSAAVLVAVLAVGAALLLTLIPGAAKPAVLVVLIASGSAAVVLPIIEERKIEGQAALTVIAQVTVADIGAMIAVPFVLRPAHAGQVALGTLLIAGCVIALLGVGRRLRATSSVKAIRKEGKKRHWAVDLRIALVVLFGLGWIAERTGTSLLIAGFGAGLMVASIGGPKRLSTEVLGIGGGFFVPLFFVVLGARIDLRGVVQHPAMLALALALAAVTVVVHLAAAFATGQRPGAGLLACAQLGVPSAVVALGLPAHIITDTQAAAIIAASVISLGVCAQGAAILAAAGRKPPRRVADVYRGATSASSRPVRK